MNKKLDLIIRVFFLIMLILQIFFLFYNMSYFSKFSPIFLILVTIYFVVKNKKI